jgi:hypothetical protein
MLYAMVYHLSALGPSGCACCPSNPDGLGGMCGDLNDAHSRSCFDQTCVHVWQPVLWVWVEAVVQGGGGNGLSTSAQSAWQAAESVLARVIRTVLQSGIIAKPV